MSLTAALTYTNCNYVALPVMVFVSVLVQIIIYAHMEKLFFFCTNEYIFVGGGLGVDG